MDSVCGTRALGALAPLVAAVRDGKWHWGLGDPTVGAVLVTAWYLVTAIICLTTARQVHRIGREARTSMARRSETLFWLSLSFILFLLGVNKQADLQTLITVYGRDLAKSLGWYQYRAVLQVGFIVAVGIIACGGAAAAIWLVRKWPMPCRWAAVGLSVQAAFVVMRATSFHHVDQMLGLKLGDIKINLLLESIGLTIMLVAALVHRHRVAKTPRPR